MSAPIDRRAPFVDHSTSCQFNFISLRSSYFLCDPSLSFLIWSLDCDKCFILHRSNIDVNEPEELRFDSGSEIVGDMDCSTSFDCHGSVSRNCLACPQDPRRCGIIDIVVLRYRRPLTFCQALCSYIWHDCFQNLMTRHQLCQDSGNELVVINRCASRHDDMHPLSIVTRLRSASPDVPTLLTIGGCTNTRSAY